jgi:tRNA-dihydrouridine synthase
MARALETAGLYALIVHARTRDQGYAGKADWSLIEGIKAAAGIPIIGNGDVTSGASAVAMLQTTGCDGIMIGRAALGNPWVFRDCREALSGKETWNKPDRKEIYRTFLIHFRGLRSEMGPMRATRVMKRFASWYTRGFRGAPAARAAIHKSTRGRAIRKAVKGVLLGSCAT